ncbi:hypothetical protein KSS87_022640 [Heliosperma pusillum]|nr:hypothetical protein KSS87_022640 [Heliosperma pusillum]
MLFTFFFAWNLVSCLAIFSQVLLITCRQAQLQFGRSYNDQSYSWLQLIVRLLRVLAMGL